MFADKVLVFDLDGTLYDYDAAIEQEVDANVAEFFMHKLQLDKAGTENLIKDIRSRYQYDVEALDKEFPFPKKDFMDYICNVDVSHLPRNTKLDSLLKDFPQHKFILTDSTERHVLDVLSVIGVSSDRFAGIFDGHDMKYKFKHCAEGFDLFLRRYGLKAQDCMLFEDNLCNLKIAKGLGFSTAYINLDKAFKPSFCDYCFSNINEALTYFQDFPQK